MGSIPKSGRSVGDFPNGLHGNSLQHFCLGNFMNKGAWQATVHRIAKLDTTEAT